MVQKKPTKLFASYGEAARLVIATLALIGTAFLVGAEVGWWVVVPPFLP